MRFGRAVLALLLVATLAGCASPAAPTGTGKIGGQVMGPDGSAYAHARVLLDPGGQQQTTDGQGMFLFNGLAAGSYTLHFTPVSGPEFSVVEKLDDGQERTDEMFMPEPANGSSSP